MDYAQLGLGQSASVITSMELRDWGAMLIVACTYEPGGQSKPYRIIFDSCRDIRCVVLDDNGVLDENVDMVGILIGADAHRKPAVITTDVFELTVIYGRMSIEK